MQTDQESRPRLLLIAPPNSYRTVAYIEAARRRGVDVLVASEGKYSLVAAVAGGLHLDLDAPGAVDILLSASRAWPFSGVVATDDATVELASRIAGALGLPHNPPQAARLSCRKDLSRLALADAGVSIPEFRLVDLHRPVIPQLRGLALPCVVKPLSLSASRGVMRADTLEELQSACTRLRHILAAEELRDPYLAAHILVERFIPGPEVALEGLLQGGRLDVLAVFDKPDPLQGPCFEETYYITPSRHDAGDLVDIHACVTAACAAQGLREGPIHAELRLACKGAIVIEIASRTIGGECARLLDFGTGRDLETLVIAHAIGKPLAIQEPPGGAGVLMIPIPEAGILRRVEGISAARAVPFIEDIVISIREGYELVPLPEGSSYLGFIFARAPSPQQAEAALRAAHAHLNFVVAPVMKLMDGAGITSV